MQLKLFVLTCTLSFVLITNINAGEIKSGIQVGDIVQQFAANDHNGNMWSLSDNLNQKFLVVYFYPAAMTGG